MEFKLKFSTAERVLIEAIMERHSVSMSKAIKIMIHAGFKPLLTVEPTKQPRVLEE